MTYQDYTIIAKRADGRLFGDTVTSDSPVADFKEIYRHGGAFEIVAVIPGTEPYGELAKKHMGVETLEYQADVDLDIHALSYLQIKNALRDAYYRGYVAGQEQVSSSAENAPVEITLLGSVPDGYGKNLIEENEERGHCYHII